MFFLEKSLSWFEKNSPSFFKLKSTHWQPGLGFLLHRESCRLSHSLQTFRLVPWTSQEMSESWNTVPTSSELLSSSSSKVRASLKLNTKAKMIKSFIMFNFVLSLLQTLISVELVTGLTNKLKRLVQKNVFESKGKQEAKNLFIRCYPQGIFLFLIFFSIQSLASLFNKEKRKMTFLEVILHKNYNYQHITLFWLINILENKILAKLLLLND